jgi:hypothetical protein
VTAESLAVPGDIGQPKVIDASSYVNGDVWVGRPASMELSLTTDFPLRIPIERPILSMRLSPDRTSATDGVIAGFVPVEAWVDIIRTVAGSFDEGLCTGTTFESLADQFRQAADSLLDGTQDPSRSCEAISIGLGFDAAAVSIGSVAAPVPPEPDPCAP